VNLHEAVKQYGGRLLRYATGILHNHADAEDAVQDAFLAAYRGRNSFDGTNLQAWLYKITYNTCINKRRKRGLLFFADLKNEPASNEPTTGDALPEMMRALAPLKPDDRAILYARIIEGYSYDELSEIMGKNPAALRKAYMRAKAKAASLLAMYMEV
jgi:RNA polymerase sigma-70 factor (ECF subfamily)